MSLKVLADATWEVKSGDRLGLVGANGEGKTTQFRILAGDIEPTAGEIVKSGKNLRTALLRQEVCSSIWYLCGSLDLFFGLPATSPVNCYYCCSLLMNYPWAIHFGMSCVVHA